jgi:hypothetical protein
VGHEGLGSVLVDVVIHTEPGGPHLLRDHRSRVVRSQPPWAMQLAAAPRSGLGRSQHLSGPSGPTTRRHRWWCGGRRVPVLARPRPAQPIASSAHGQLSAWPWSAHQAGEATHRQFARGRHSGERVTDDTTSGAWISSSWSPGGRSTERRSKRPVSAGLRRVRALHIRQATPHAFPGRRETQRHNRRRTGATGVLPPRRSQHRGCRRTAPRSRRRRAR